MRHGRASAVSAAISGLSPAENSPFPQLFNVLLVASLSKTLSQSGTRNLDANSIPISEPVVLQILRQNSLDPSKKLDLFRWCFSLRPGYKHSASTYPQIFRTVCRTGLLGEVPDLLGSMKKDGITLDQTMSMVLLDSLIRSGKFDSALGVLDYMEELGDCLNPSLYDSVLVTLVKKNELRLALSIFFKLLEASDNHSETCGVIVSYLPGTVAVNELLVSLGRADMRSEFKRVFEKLKGDEKIQVDTWGYNICRNGLFRASCWIYNILIDGLFRNGMAEAGFTLFCDLKKKG